MTRFEFWQNSWLVPVFFEVLVLIAWSCWTLLLTTPGAPRSYESISWTDRVFARFPKWLCNFAFSQPEPFSTSNRRLRRLSDRSYKDLSRAARTHGGRFAGPVLLAALAGTLSLIQLGITAYGVIQSPAESWLLLSVALAFIGLGALAYTFILASALWKSRVPMSWKILYKTPSMLKRAQHRHTPGNAELGYELGLLVDESLRVYMVPDRRNSAEGRLTDRSWRLAHEPLIRTTSAIRLSSRHERTVEEVSEVLGALADLGVSFKFRGNSRKESQNASVHAPVPAVVHPSPLSAVFLLLGMSVALALAFVAVQLWSTGGPQINFAALNDWVTVVVTALTGMGILATPLVWMWRRWKSIH